MPAKFSVGENVEVIQTTCAPTTDQALVGAVGYVQIGYPSPPDAAKCAAFSYVVLLPYAPGGPGSVTWHKFREDQLERP